MRRDGKRQSVVATAASILAPSPFSPLPFILLLIPLAIYPASPRHLSRHAVSLASLEDAISLASLVLLDAISLASLVFLPVFYIRLHGCGGLLLLSSSPPDL